MNQSTTKLNPYFNIYSNKIVIPSFEGKEVWLYLRVSTKGQFDKNHSIQNQKRKIAKKVEELGAIITKDFGGTYESAKNDYDRKGFKSLIDSIKSAKKKPFAIMVNDMSRFSRTGGSANGIIYDLKRLGVFVYDVSTGDNTLTERGELNVYTSSINAFRDNVIRKEILRPNIVERMSEGVIMGKAPMGYDHFGPRVSNISKIQGIQELVVNRDGEFLKIAFGYKLSGQYSDAQIIKKLLALGFKIRPQKLSKIWRNPFYCGILVSKFLPNPVKGKWEPLISESQFIKLQKLLQENPSGFQHNSNDLPKVLGAKFSKCSNCGGTITGYLNKLKKIYYYKCPKCNKNANADTTPHSKNKGLNSIFACYLASFKIPDSIVELVKLQTSKIFSELNKENTILTETLKANREKIEKQIISIKKDWGLGLKPEDVCKIAINDLELKLVAISQELERAPSPTSNLNKILEIAINNLQNIDKMWLSLNYDGKRSLQKAMFPLGLTIDLENRQFLTNQENNFISLINSISTTYVQNKKGINQALPDLSPMVARPGFEPGTSGL